MPEWQGVGVGVAFLETVCQAWLRGENRYGKKMQTIMTTAHPGLCRALRRREQWRQVSCKLYGDNKARASKSLSGAASKVGGWSGSGCNIPGYGGHFRAIQGFRYIGEQSTG